jgi:hypothetical protein
MAPVGLPISGELTDSIKKSDFAIFQREGNSLTGALADQSIGGVVSRLLLFQNCSIRTRD